MEGILTRFVAGEILQDPFIVKLLFYTILFLGAAQAVKIIHSLWVTGKIKTQEKVVEEKRGQWAELVAQLVAELKLRNERADKIYDLVQKIYDKTQWLYEVHHKFDDDGVPLWYVRKSLEKVIVKLSDSIEKQTQIMGQISEGLRDQKHNFERIENKLSSRQ